MPLALVTGANRGIRLETARQLVERGCHVLLGSRDAEAGAAAARAIGAGAEAVKLDVTDADDIATVERRLAGGPALDLLVNNVGVALDGFNPDVARRTLDVNTRGTVAVTDALVPRMPKGGTIVFVSSGMGELRRFDPPIPTRFRSAGREELAALARDFEAAVAAGTALREGWPQSAYSVSKALVNGYVRVIAEEVAPRAIAVNAVCPGWVRTRMSGPIATRDAGEGAASVLATAFDSARPTGGFFRDGRAIPF